MKSMRLLTRTGIALIAASLAACGGGSGGGTAATGGSVSKGVITAKGSVFVNGIKYTINNGTTIRIDDNPGVESDLKVGMVVEVKGPKDEAAGTGTATLIKADDSLEGTISGVDPVNKTITVMGQTVKIEDNVTRLNDDSTQKVFADAGFQVGDSVEVNGFPDDKGGLRATRVAQKASGEFEIKGIVTGTGNGSFTLSISPDVAANSVLTVNFAGALPAVGAFVEVKSNAAPVGGVITATAVEIEDDLGAAGAKVEVEGIVTSGDVNSFTVNGQQVVTTPSTLFQGGLKSDFAVGIKVEAEGPLNADGAIVARKISFRSNIKIQDDAVNVTAGSLTVLGKTIVINQFTEIDNGPLAEGAHVEVRAFPANDGSLVATRIVVISDDNRAILQGPVANVNAAAGTFAILGIAITTNGATEFEIDSDSSSDQLVSAATFFANLKENVTVVKVRWDNFTGTANPVKQAEIELGK